MCRFCDLNEVGDEHNFLKSCTNIKFISLRAKFIKNLFKMNSYFKQFPSIDLFIYIVGMKDESIMIKTQHKALQIILNDDMVFILDTSTFFTADVVSAKSKICSRNICKIYTIFVLLRSMPLYLCMCNIYISL